MELMQTFQPSTHCTIYWICQPSTHCLYWETEKPKETKTCLRKIVKIIEKTKKNKKTKDPKGLQRHGPGVQRLRPLVCLGILVFFLVFIGFLNGFHYLFWGMLWFLWFFGFLYFSLLAQSELRLLDIDSLT